MKDIYDPDLEQRIHDFINRKTKKYPELKIFERAGIEHSRPAQHKALTQPPRVVLHNM